MTVATKKVAGRRTLHFNSHQEVLDDARRLASGPHRQLGNWSLGQVCDHLAKTIDMSLDGSQARFPWLLRMIGPYLVNRFITRPMSAGFTAPPSAGITPDEQETQAGLAALELAVARLDQTNQRKPHGLFGPMTREQWDQLHMRHGELHLSFIVPEVS
jgi:hypothetical protein